MNREDEELISDDVYILGNEKISKQRTSSILQYPKDPLYESVEVQLMNWKSEKLINVETQYFELEVRIDRQTKQWKI